MRKGILVGGIILLIVGAILMVVLWPMVGYDKPSDIIKKMEKGELKEGDEYKMIGTVKDTVEIGGEKYMYIEGFEIETYDELTNTTTKMPLPVPNSIGASKGDTVIIEGRIGDSNVKEAKVPTPGGIFGLILLIIGIIVAIVGAVKKPKVKAEGSGEEGAVPPESQ